MTPEYFRELALELGNLVTEKNAAYGDSARSSADIMRVLFPNGIPVDRYIDALLIVRMLDKLQRLATKPDAFNESPFRDIAGYALRGLEIHESRQAREGGEGCKDSASCAEGVCEMDQGATGQAKGSPLPAIETQKVWGL